MDRLNGDVSTPYIYSTHTHTQRPAHASELPSERPNKASASEASLNQEDIGLGVTG